MTAPSSTQRLPVLTLAALGVVYGDIGTSPLYAIKEVFGGAHHAVPITPENILGILSLLVWTLIMVVTVKYAVFIMRANNHGDLSISKSSFSAMGFNFGGAGDVSKDLIDDAFVIDTTTCK